MNFNFLKFSNFFRNKLVKGSAPTGSDYNPMEAMVSGGISVGIGGGKKGGGSSKKGGSSGNDGGDGGTTGPVKGNTPHGKDGSSDSTDCEKGGAADSGTTGDGQSKGAD